MRRSTIGLAVFTSALLLLAFAPSVSVALEGLEVTIGAQDAWKYKFTVKEGFVGPQGSAPLDAVFKVKKGNHLIFRFDPNASGAWRDGDSVS